MSDSSAERSGPDFLDRLIARHAAPAATPRPGAGRVRPRLPGPFERVEAVRAQAATPDEDGLLWPSTTPTVLPPPDAPRPAATGEARVYTERERTVVRTERAPAEPASRPAAQAAPEIPLLRPAAPLVPRQVPSAAGRRAAGQGRSDRGADRPAASVPTLPGADAAPPAVVSAALRPAAADTTAARDAVRQAAARRPARAAEQVVQVQIGRLEVTAAESPSGGARQRRTPQAGRAGATVSLAEYLARGRE
ncbi:hypothetical protein OG252_39685 [Streptomyces sp. NBC_01352]|uniref:hypothetical protein n=1 Tax=Streptomyces sp. NBC_01352 TaxID=2903834 RepID=UPI002E35DE9F|nr:hypothetical protein [Streptomyces sp. NBC_01352]